MPTNGIKDKLLEYRKTILLNITKKNNVNIRIKLVLLHVMNTSCVNNFRR